MPPWQLVVVQEWPFVVVVVARKLTVVVLVAAIKVVAVVEEMLVIDVEAVDEFVEDSIVNWQ